MPDLSLPLPFCVRMEDGHPEPAPSFDEVHKQLTGSQVSPSIAAILQSRTMGATKSSAISEGLDPENLAQAGWGVLFGAAVSDEIKAAMQPLLDWRKGQAGQYFFNFEGAKGYTPGLSARKWIARNNASFTIGDPKEGVPFYLLIIADPSDIPFEFQYDLDLARAVGRLWFDQVDDFARYAESVVAQEKEQDQQKSAPRPKELGIFAPRHDHDAATQMFHDYVAMPLHQGNAHHQPVGQMAEFEHLTLLAGDATRSAFSNLLTRDGGAPALLLTGSHGLGLDLDNQQQFQKQGALVCSDWPGQGPIAADQVMTGADVPADAKVAGMIHFFFACYGAGCPDLDNFSRHLPAAPRIASKSFIAALPQALLAHPGGSALAVVGHVERAWSYSFINEFGQPSQGMFRNVVTALMQGRRVGQAMESAASIWAIHSTRLADLQFEAQHDPDFDYDSIMPIWIARDDARNLVILGDPAVRLAL